MTCYRRAQELQPDHAEMSWHQAFAWLLTGDFAHGWPAYEEQPRQRAESHFTADSMVEATLAVYREFSNGRPS